METNYFGNSPESHRELARAYVPFQRYSKKFSLSKALRKGTLYQDLSRPYHRRR
ncbi:MAG: spore coat associated protein CotJA [Bacillota bacterium]